MGWYNRYVLPKLIHCACGQKVVQLQRQKIVPKAYGNVLEVGIGSGHNLPFYHPDKVSRVIGIDPSEQSWKLRAPAASKLPFMVEYIKAEAAEIPLENAQFDSVVMTYTLCSIFNPLAAFHEIHRVLKPGGTLFYCEHGKAPDKVVSRWQNIITPVWKHLGGGCHLNRDIPRIIAENGFLIDHLETGYLPGWRPGSFNYLGWSKKR